MDSATSPSRSADSQHSANIDETHAKSDDDAPPMSPTEASHELLPSLAARRFADYLDKARKNEDDAAHGDDPDAIHDLRVAIRRMRTALGMLEDAPGFDAKESRSLRKDLRPLSHALGAARDLDLMLANLDAFAEHAGGSEGNSSAGDSEGSPDSGLAAIRDALVDRRANAQKRVRKVLARRKTQRALHGVEQMTAHEEKAAKQADQHNTEPEAVQVMVRAYAGGAIWRAYGTILAFERNQPNPTLDQWHRLRINSKQMRYILEFFADALGPGSDPLIAALTRAQDELGALQDARSRNDVLHSLAHDLPANHNHHAGHNHRAGHAGHNNHAGHSDAGSQAGDTSNDQLPTGAASDYAGALVAERDKLTAGAPDQWHAVADITFRRDLASLIAEL